jgi:hypothetical protein
MLFKDTITLSGPWWWKLYAPLKRRYICTRPHDTTSLKTAIFILAAVRTWNLTLFEVFIVWILTKYNENNFRSSNCSVKKFTELFWICNDKFYGTIN